MLLNSPELLLDALNSPGTYQHNRKTSPGHTLADYVLGVDRRLRVDSQPVLVEGEAGPSHPEIAIERLFEGYSAWEASEKSGVKGRLKPLEAWMQAEVAAAGIAGAIEENLGKDYDDNDVYSLRCVLAARAIGVSYEDFMKLRGNN